MLILTIQWKTLMLLVFMAIEFSMLLLEEGYEMYCMPQTYIDP